MSIKAKTIFKNAILILSLFSLNAFFINQMQGVYDEGVFVAIPLTILTIYLWRKIDDKFFTK